MRSILRGRGVSRRLFEVMPVLLFALLASAAVAQTPRAADVSPRFGTTDQILYHIGFAEMTPEQSTYPYSTVLANGHEGRISSGGAASFLSHPHVPSGALLTSLEFDSCDTDAGVAHMSAELTNCDRLGSGCIQMGTINTTGSAIGSGCSTRTFDLTSQNVTMDNETRQLIVRVSTSSGDAHNLIIGASVGYRLQVSPGPGVATFGDVPTSSPQFKFVEALVSAGITAGCGNGNYCPNSPITRGQMAVFLATALGLHFPN